MDDQRRGRRRGLLGFGLIFGVFGLLLVGFAVRLVIETRAAQDWTETTCTMIGAELRHGKGRKHRERDRVDVRYEYMVASTKHIGERWSAAQASIDTHASEGREIVAMLAPGSQHPCWFDPTDPSRAALNRDLPNAVYWLPLLGLVFLGVGAFLIRASNRTSVTPPSTS